MQIRHLAHCMIHDKYLTNVISAVKENYNVARVTIVNKNVVENMQQFSREALNGFESLFRKDG